MWLLALQPVAHLKPTRGGEGACGEALVGLPSEVKPSRLGYTTVRASQKAPTGTIAAFVLRRGTGTPGCYQICWDEGRGAKGGEEGRRGAGQDGSWREGGRNGAWLGAEEVGGGGCCHFP